jgi:hypothetical protein
MELYTLHLHKALRYGRLFPPSLEALLELAGSAAEGSESLAVWDIDALLLEGDDGPRLRDPLPAPIWTGSATAELDAADGAAQALSPTTAPEARPKLALDTENFSLAEGSYLFCQARASDPAELRELLEWFVRESWWSGDPVRDRLYLRLVREDGKTAAQALARNAKL